MTYKIFHTIVFMGFLLNFDIFAQKEKLLFSEKFASKLDTVLWKIEMEDKPNSSVKAENNHLEMDTRGGVTVWLNKKLSGNFRISYKRKVVSGSRQNDRLSDMNQFWLANDPKNSNLFTRKGKFEEYDSLSLYYVGFGGNTNTTTRFRKYLGNGEKPMLQEKNESENLLKADHEYTIKIVIQQGKSSFWVDNQLLFEYQDATPLREGYFGFRSTYSHQFISDFEIYTLE